MVDAHVEVVGLQEMLKKLKGAKNKELRGALVRAMNTAAKPVKEEIKESARRTLPSGGGLGEWAANLDIKTKTSLTSRRPGVTIQASARAKVKRARRAGRIRKVRLAGTFGQFADVRALDRGRVMHPMFGRAKKGGGLFGPQMVKPGFFTDVVTGPVSQRAGVEIKRELDKALDAIGD